MVALLRDSQNKTYVAEVLSTQYAEETGRLILKCADGVERALEGITEHNNQIVCAALYMDGKADLTIYNPYVPTNLGSAFL